MTIPKIDLVYTWVDGNDKNWQRKYQDFVIRTDEKNFKARYSNNQELLYSLRSVEKFAPWINHIFIITDNQIPKWLNTNNPKISIIDHKRIIPMQFLPTFNSIVIEHCIKNIPNLSEYFLYANDDMFFFNEVTPDFFFTDKGKTINRYYQIVSDTEKNAYLDLIKNGLNLLREKYGNIPLFLSHHNIDAYKKSVIDRCYHLFQKEINATMNSKYRTPFDIPRFIYNDYACLINQGIYKQKLEDSLYIDKDFPYDLDQYLQEHQPKLLCLNDVRSTTEKDKEIYINLLKQYFPLKSQFEK